MGLDWLQLDINDSVGMHCITALCDKMSVSRSDVCNKACTCLLYINKDRQNCRGHFYAAYVLCTAFDSKHAEAVTAAALKLGFCCNIAI